MKNPFNSLSKELKIELEETQSQHLICRLELNGVSGRFLLDTGASNCCLDREQIGKFSVLPQGDQLPLTGAGKEKLKATNSQKSVLHFAGKKIDSLSFILIDMETINSAFVEQNELPIDGIIGADLLHKKKAIIDYHYPCLLLHNTIPF